ncbi:uncharacterized protein LOC6557198 isoform X1 [Drosophila grimshawi]|uniref:GH15979 n=1 Tax=Drosophila grimshawi TaxID=7222 RepID=B4J213_DROGR|nr:uncharacterized protein LOC6557198 isoform X1 [Drosophila grimshawi]EDV95938.1 GH15979 [Drosophila grimshawi]
MEPHWTNNYCKHHVNGTLYVITCLPMTAVQLMALESGAGEIFLTRIKKQTTPEDIMRVAIQLDDVYMLRFKIDFSFRSRGYAYLQYVNVDTMERALAVLQSLFRQAKLKIQVRQSNNLKSLFLKDVNHLNPLQVYEELRLIWRYDKLYVLEYKPLQYAYIIEYRNNYEATIAFNVLKSQMGIFGNNLFVIWVNKDEHSPVSHPVPNCCAVLLRYQLNWMNIIQPYYPCFMF